MINEIEDVEDLLEKVRFSMYKKDMKKAERQIEELIRRIEKYMEQYDSETTEYFNFENLFELFLYDQKCKNDKKRKWIHYPFAEIYRLYGELLMEMKRPKEANRYLKEAIRWNPVSARIHFEYAESLRQLERMEEYLIVTKNIFEMAYTRPDLARIYRNLGYYFLRKADYKASIGCYLWSLQYEKDSKEAQAQLCYMKLMSDEELEQPDIEEFEQIAIKEGFPLEVNREILGIAIGYGDYFAKQGNDCLARSMYSIVYDLTHAKQFEELMKVLDDSDENN